ncbi:MAG: Soluble lytic murein transglycosylase [Gammaproteobacteria bacterium]|nr:Soluble lytic murein transglycosylase [Gammaproteobacteria bacterium]
MKSSRRFTFRVLGLYSVVLVALAALVPAMEIVTPTGRLAQAAPWGEPPPRHGFTVVTEHRRVPYVPVTAQPRSTLRTVRSRYDLLIESVARRHDVESALVKAIVQAESAFDPWAVSRSGAQGLMQVLPETASRFAIDDLSDPRENLNAGVRYLKQMLERFDGDVTMAVAAYNAGPNAVRRYRGVPPYSETRRYLSKVMRLRNAYAD